MTSPLTDAEIEELERLTARFLASKPPGHLALESDARTYAEAMAAVLPRLLTAIRASRRAAEAARENLRCIADGILAHNTPDSVRDMARAALAALDGRARQERTK